MKMEETNGTLSGVSQSATAATFSCALGGGREMDAYAGVDTGKSESYGD
jgi:hypothetical protein